MDEGTGQLATRQFDDACRLIRAANGRPMGMEALGQRLGEVAGRDAPSRWALAKWRNGTTDVPAWALLAAFELAGITQHLEMHRGRGRRRNGAAGLAAQAVAGGVRLQVWAGSLAFIPVMAMLVLAGLTNSWDPHVWWGAARQVLQHAASPPSSSRAAIVAPPALAPASIPAPAPNSPPSAAPDAAASPGPTGSAPRPQEPGAALVALASEPGPPPSPGVHMASDPRGAGGMTGTVREGPGSAGGTIDGAGARGCTGVQPVSQLCGSANVPGSPLPLPPLPAPSIPAVLP